MTDTKPLCYCFNVTETDIRAHFAKPGATYEDLVRDTAIGTKCTACLFDLDIVMESIHQGHAKVMIGPKERARRRFGQLLISDFADSGFFVCDDNVKTTLHLSNFGQMYDDEFALIDFNYNVLVFAESGQLVSRQAGRIDSNTDCTIDLNKLVPGIDRGWFLIALHALDEGFFGTLRPQIALSGKGWTASYHTQPHAMATRDRYRYSVVTAGDGERLATRVSIINAVERRTGLEIEVSSAAGGFQRTVHQDLPPRGAAIEDLDILFPEAPKDEPVFVTVRSARPTRKHIINEHRDGSWSVDHFPN